MSTAGLTAALATHLRDPMRRSAYALILGTGLTSALGLVFWALAARWLDPVTVGLGAALVSTVVLLANVSTLGLRNGLIRFLPQAGSASSRLIITCYALCVTAALAAAGIFLLGQPLWAQRLDFLRSSKLGMAAFAVGTALWVLFVLQDHVLVGLRCTVWVPLENGLCAVAKIGLLPVLSFAGGWAIFGASVIPAAAAAVVVTALVLRYVRRATAAEKQGDIPVSRLVRFAAADHFAALLWMGTSDVLTLLVLDQMGAAASAYYYMANTIGYSLYLVTSNVVSALVAEGALYPDRVVTLARQALWNSARLVVPLAAVGFLVAPWVLAILGPDYVENATPLLRLLLASAVPQIVIGIAIGTARLRQDLRIIVVVYAALAVGSIGGSWLTLSRVGLVGLGFACFATQLVVALVLVVSGRTGLWSEGGWRAVRSQIEQLPRTVRRLQSRRETTRRLSPALRACGLDPNTGDDVRLLTSDSDTLVAAVEAPQPLIVKIATSAESTAGLDRHAETVSWLTSNFADQPFISTLPQLVRRAELDGQRVLIETRLPGSAEVQDVFAPGLTRAATTAVAELHAATSAVRMIDEELLWAWVKGPMAELRRLGALAGSRNGMDALQEELTRSLHGRQVTIACAHGDFWPGNVLLTAAKGGFRVTGLVDWENARTVGLPDVDLVHWWLAIQPHELGAAVWSALAEPEKSTRAFGELGVPLPNPDLPFETVVLLAWLWHVAAGLTRASAGHLHRVWLTRNVKPIVQLFERRARASAQASLNSSDHG